MQLVRCAVLILYPHTFCAYLAALVYLQHAVMLPLLAVHVDLSKTTF